MISSLISAYSVILKRYSQGFNAKRFIYLFVNLVIISSLTGCGTVQFDNVKMNNKGNPVATKLTDEQKKSMAGLTATIRSLSPNVSPQEAVLVAHDSIVYSMVLANQYELTYPPLWHNVLVNSKKRPRGLCYHWQRDLMKHFKSKNLKTLDIVEGVAHEKNYWLEHNTMVVTAKGHAFDTGVVLDPWRKSGILSWARVKEDKYPWKLRVWKKKKNTQITKQKNISSANAL